MTHEEAYHSIKETCREEVKILMAEHGRRLMEEVSKRPPSRDNDYRMELARDKSQTGFLVYAGFLIKVSHTHFMKCHR